MTTVSTAEIAALDRAVAEAREALDRANDRLYEVMPEYNARQQAVFRAGAALDKARKARNEITRGAPLHPSTVRGILVKAGLRKVDPFSERFSVEQGIGGERCTVTFWRGDTRPDDPRLAVEALTAAGLEATERRPGWVTVSRPRPTVTD